MPLRSACLHVPPFLSYFRYGTMLKSDDNHILNLSTSVIAKDVKDQYSFWRKIIWDYSGRKLTMIEDRLPAISGVVADI